MNRIVISSLPVPYLLEILFHFVYLLNDRTSEVEIVNYLIIIIIFILIAYFASLTAGQRPPLFLPNLSFLCYLWPCWPLERHQIERDHLR